MGQTTILNEFQKFQYQIEGNKLRVFNFIKDLTPIFFDFTTFEFKYKDKIGKFYFHGTSIVFLFIDNNRKLNVMTLKDEEFLK